MNDYGRGGTSHGLRSVAPAPFGVLPFFIIIYVIYLCGVPNKAIKKKKIVLKKETVGQNISFSSSLKGPPQKLAFSRIK